MVLVMITNIDYDFKPWFVYKYYLLAGYFGLKAKLSKSLLLWLF